MHKLHSIFVTKRIVKVLCENDRWYKKILSMVHAESLLKWYGQAECTAYDKMVNVICGSTAEGTRRGLCGKDEQMH